MLKYTKDVMEELKKAGWSEYKIRNSGMLATSAIKAIKCGDTSISTRSIDRICEMLGGVQPGYFLEYFDPIANTNNRTFVDPSNLDLVDFVLNGCKPK